MRRAFDRGVTHFDLANNYGPPPGAAEERFGRMIAADFAPYRDEIIVSSKAGYLMWPRALHGECRVRARTYSPDLEAGASLKRLGLDLRRHFFITTAPIPRRRSKRPCRRWPTRCVRARRCTSASPKNYRSAPAKEAIATLRGLGVACLVNQVRYSLLERDIETDGLLGSTLAAEGAGCVAFSPLRQGILTGKYLDGIPE